ncbi:MAG: metallophosphoesterase [Chitinophaga sp.]|uniref:metallophosphoesterase family protein n=1 Tax=Chitinophaga sp. TaxID=1869181 RepID=UPI0025C6DB95|nr:metallophosphoesterase [Chitinophaga sp.]MBV8255884.1 metallophosphoesterase [Chitinophaga sp.]
MMNRRDFLNGISAAVIISACGKFAKAANRFHFDSETVFRFAIGSDWHYGEPNTPYEQYFQDLKKAFDKANQTAPCDCFILNGDVIHNNPELLEPASTLFKTIHPKVFATRGNHDRVTAGAWENAWGLPLQHDQVINNQVLLFGDTSDIEGNFLAPDVAWFTEKLAQYRRAKNIFIFLHITPVKWTQWAADSPDFAKLIRQYPNVKAIFNGHDHDQDNVKLLDDKIPFLFDSHIGGSWGTQYRGFRIVEVKKDNSMLTYMLNPTEKMNEYHKAAVASK